MNKILIIFLSFAPLLPLGAQVNLKNNWVEPGHEILATGYNPNGTYVYTLGSDNRIIVRETSTGSIQKAFTTKHEQTSTAKFSADGRFIISGGTDKIVAVWNFAIGEIFRELEGHTGAVTCLAVGKNPAIIASGSKDNTIRIWNISTGEEMFVLEGLTDEVTSIDFHPAEDILIGSSADGTIALWNTEKGRLITSHNADMAEAHQVVFSPNGNFYAVGGSENRVTIWNIYNQLLQNFMLGHSGDVHSLTFSPDGRYLLSGDCNEYILLTRMNSWEIEFHSAKQGGGIASLAFNPDGTSFSSATRGSATLKIWDTSQLNIESAAIIASRATVSHPVPVAEVEWITANHTESMELGLKTHFRIRTEEPIEYLNTYLNNDIYSIETNPKLVMGVWNELNKIIYLEDGDNEVFIELIFDDGRVVSDVLNVAYRYDIVSSMLSSTGDVRNIRVMLRAADRYEYVVRGAEGYSFYSGLIETDSFEGDTISVELIPLREETTILLNNIHFATNSAALTSESLVELDRVVDLMVINPLFVIEISAHTCDLGAIAYNKLLSERRAESVVNYLLDSGIAEERLVARGYGLRNPIVPNTSEENRALNRRVEFTIIDIRHDSDTPIETTHDKQE